MDILQRKLAISDAPETERVEICPLCEDRNFEFMFWGCDRLYHIPGKFGTLKCNNCGLVRLSPRPTVNSVSTYYPDDYGAYVNPASIQAISDGDPFGLRNMIRRSVLAELGYPSSGSLLEIQPMRAIFSSLFFEREHTDSVISSRDSFRAAKRLKLAVVMAFF